MLSALRSACEAVFCHSTEVSLDVISICVALWNLNLLK